MTRNIINFFESIMIIGAIQAGLVFVCVVMLNIISKMDI